MTVIDYSFALNNDSVEISEVHRVDVASGSLAAMSTRALATVGISIGATKYSSTTKCYSKQLRHVEGVTWDVSVYWRTEQIEDRIENAASGTVIDKGIDSHSEGVLRDRHPTSGSAYQLGSWFFGWEGVEPRQDAWFEVVHTSSTGMLAQGKDIVGALNSASWNGDAPGQWLCKGAFSRTVHTDTGDRYITRYEFSYSANAWGLAAKRHVWNNTTLLSVSAATLATGLFTLYRSTTFPTGWVF